MGTSWQQGGEEHYYAQSGAILNLELTGFADVLDVNFGEKSKKTPMRCRRMRQRKLGKRNQEFGLDILTFFMVNSLVEIFSGS